MSIIRTHDITLYGRAGEHAIVLRSLCDEHLVLLYRWNADSEVVYWSDSGNAESFAEEEVRGMYGNVSQNALCFLVEVDGNPIGDFWLQQMNIPDITARYPMLDVRRIDATIGEKAWWGRGIGTAVLGMLIEYAFDHESVDMLYCFVDDYNIRSQRMLLKQGFQLCGEEKMGDENPKAKKTYHFQLTRSEYIESLACRKGDRGCRRKW